MGSRGEGRTANPPCRRLRFIRWLGLPDAHAPFVAYKLHSGKSMSNNGLVVRKSEFDETLSKVIRKANPNRNYLDTIRFQGLSGAAGTAGRLVADRTRSPARKGCRAEGPGATLKP